MTIQRYVSRRAKNHGGRMLSALIFFGAALGLGCTSESRREPTRQPDLVLIVLDTVRADHLGVYGYPRDTTPEIDTFARGATRFLHAVSTAPWTLPSHASLFTGLFPFEHGVHARPPDASETSVRALAAGHPTLAELLRGEGYRTAAFAANALLNPVFGLDRGFDTWHFEDIAAEKLNRRVFDWLDRAGERPFFLFVNYMDAHRVYNTTGRRSFLLPADPADRGEPLERLTQIVLPGTTAAPPDLVARVIGEYDTAIANLDDAVGALLRKLRRLRRFENSVIVITSDHGEAFGEHLLVEHGRDVYEEMLAVPLLVRAPRQVRGAIADDLVSSADVPHLILEQDGLHVAAGAVARFPPPRRRGLVIAENHLTRNRDRSHRLWGHRFGRERWVLYDWPHKLIASSDGHHELYDLAADPREATNLLKIRSDVAGRLQAELRTALERPRAASAAGEAVVTDEALRAKLRALGYL